MYVPSWIHDGLMFSTKTWHMLTYVDLVGSKSGDEAEVRPLRSASAEVGTTSGGPERSGRTSHGHGLGHWRFAPRRRDGAHGIRWLPGTLRGGWGATGTSGSAQTTHGALAMFVTSKKLQRYDIDMIWVLWIIWGIYVGHLLNPVFLNCQKNERTLWIPLISQPSGARTHIWRGTGRSWHIITTELRFLLTSGSSPKATCAVRVGFA